MAKAGLLALALLVGLSHAAWADIVPLGLTVVGKIRKTNDAAKTRFYFQKADLEALPQADMTTSTPWTQASTFHGPRMEDVLNKVEAYGTRVDLVAYDGYVLHDVAVSDIHAFHPLLAYMSNGVYLRLRDFGPLFFVYSRDDEHEPTRRLDYTTREIRQVKEIIVK